MEVKKIGVVGAGTMGNGIAQVCAQAGYDVVMQDIDQSFVDKGLATIGKNLDRLVKREKITEGDKDTFLGRVSGATDLGAFADVDMVIEAILEEVEIKRKVFADLDKVCKPDAILASNTSSISVTKIAAATSRSDHVIGMHFFNPVPVMQLI